MYEIKVLDSKEFDEVAKSDPRYSYVDDSNMGFADRQKGVAYVRGTNIHDLNKYLINHELEELEEDESTHEDPNGIRHKKFFKDIFAPLTFNPGGIFGGSGKGPLNFLNPNNNSNQGQQEQNGGFQQDPFMANYPMGNFTVSGQGGTGDASSRVSETVTGGIQPGINSGLNKQGGIDGIQGLPPDLIQRLKGNYSGRITF